MRLTPTDRLLVQTGDLGHQTRSPSSSSIRLDSSVPPPFGFAEMTEQEVHLLVQHPIQVRFPDLAP